ncbi:helix-turn-helix domain-containing protein [Sporolactobacillus terrae]|uniref:helix-turn-helix domain-containing protein n=1 Tax=Sporolactobacillus terrae TaxID=269673 RepID=UPI00048CF552|nr:Rgg/GadR/MutR family transcriptional regulator [Sporolactobacillus terrae]
MKHPGATLRFLRKSKKMTLNELAQGEVSVAFLSRFERGDCDISFTHLLHLLERLHVSVDEFLYISNGYEVGDFQDFFTHLKRYVMEDNLHMLQVTREKMRDYYNRKKRDQYLHFSAIAALYAHRISKQNPDPNDVRILSDYLERVAIWGYYELVVYANSMYSFPPELIIKFSRMAYEKSMDYQPLEIGLDKKQLILMNTATVLMEVDRLAEANTFLVLLNDSINKENDSYMKIKLIYLRGIYLIKQGYRKRGESMARQAVQIFTELESVSQAATHANYLQDVLNSTIVKKDK